MIAYTRRLKGKDEKGHVRYDLLADGESVMEWSSISNTEVVLRHIMQDGDTFQDASYGNFVWPVLSYSRMQKHWRDEDAFDSRK